MKKYEVLSPTCYGKFSCKGGNCRTNCCSEWTISITKDEYKNTKKKKGDLDGLVCPVKHLESFGSAYQMVLREDGSCPFLTEDRLCSLQLEFGADILSNTCRKFPRVYHKYMKKLEGALSPGCERVLEILLEEKGKLKFSNYMKDADENQQYLSNTDAKKRLKYPALRYHYEIQDLCTALLQAEDASLEERMLLLGIALKRIDELVRNGEEHKIPVYIESFFEELESVDLSGQLESISVKTLAVLYNNLRVAKEQLSTSNRHYETLLRKIAERLQVKITLEASEDPSVAIETLTCSEEVYYNGRKNFEHFMKGKEYFLENLMVAWLFYNHVPFYNPEKGVWKDYLYFVWGYSMLKFVLTIILDEESTEEDMIDCCVTMFRVLGHNKGIYEKILKQFEENGTDTVAHMAIFLKA